MCWESLGSFWGLGLNVKSPKFSLGYVSHFGQSVWLLTLRLSPKNCWDSIDRSRKPSEDSPVTNTRYVYIWVLDLSLGKTFTDIDLCSSAEIVTQFWIPVETDRRTSFKSLSSLSWNVRTRLILSWKPKTCFRLTLFQKHPEPDCSLEQNWNLKVWMFKFISY